MRLRLLLPAALLALLTLVPALPAGAAPASERIVPVWAGVRHGAPVAGATVIARSRDGRLLAPPARAARNGVASLLAPRRLPRTFVLEVRRGERREAGKLPGRPVLRALVRGWTRPRVIYVNPFSTLVFHYGKLHPRMKERAVRARVQRHLGIGPGTVSPESATFWSERAFSGRRFARVARRHGGTFAYARRIAREVDGARHPHRFRLGGGSGRGGKRGGAANRASASASPKTGVAQTARLLTERLQLERELTSAAKTAVGLATGSPSALVAFGELLDSLLGGGDTGVLDQISDQLEAIQVGVNDLEQQVSAIDAEVSLAAYSSAVQSYRQTQETIDLLWEEYVHAAAAGAAGNESEARIEAEALASELKRWSNTIPSSAAVPYDEGSPGLMAWAQNAFAKGQDGGVMTLANQQLSQAAGFKWWSYWWKDLILHTEKWNNPETAGAISAANATALKNAALHGLEAATEEEYGETLPASLVYSIAAGTLYSVGTVWNIAPDVAPPASGKPGWRQMTTAEAEALPANAVGLREAMVESVPLLEDNPNPSMAGVLGEQANDGSWPSFTGTAGGYGVPPEETASFALRPSPGEECYGQWSWLENGQGSNNTTGAPIIRLCPAFVASSGSVVKAVCSQVNQRGNFFGWSEDFPPVEWSPGIWRREKAVEFVTCNDVDYWQNAGDVYTGLNWGTGVFAGDSPLSAALNISNSPSAYYALWTRAVNPGDDFLVGPVTTAG